MHLDDRSESVANNIAWFKSYPVQRALEKLGVNVESDDWNVKFNSQEWLAEFTAALYDAINEIDEAKERFKVNRFLELRTRWENAVAHSEWHGNREYDGKNRRGGQLPVGLLREMVDILPIDKVAYSLRTSVEQVLRWLFPKSDLAKLAEAASEVAQGSPISTVAEKYGIHKSDTLLPYLRAFRVEAIVQKADGRRVMPASVRQRILELASEGLGPKAVMERINAEVPGLCAKYGAVKKLVCTANRQAAA